MAIQRTKRSIVQRIKRSIVQRTKRSIVQRTKRSIVGFVILFFFLALLLHLFVSSPGGKNLLRVSTKSNDRYKDYESALEALRNMPTTSVPKMKLGSLGPFRHLAMYKESLVYIYIPKCGSSSMKTILKGEQVEMDGFNATGCFTFSMLRNPRERIVSAYSSIMTRDERGVLGVCEGKTRETYQAPPLPPVNASIDIWKEHLVMSVSYWINILEDVKLDSPDCSWDSHLIPQIEFIRGFNLSWLGCLEDVNQTYERMNQHATTVHVSPSANKTNSYEHVKGMPSEKFQTVDLLPDSVIQGIDKVYAEDWALYRAVCGYINTGTDG